MTPTIAFFPISLPDETLHSRVSRYHYLAGNTSHHQTYKDLFDAKPFRLETILPKQVDKLVKHLPDEPEIALESIISQNTLIPLYLPFLGVPENSSASALPMIYSAGRIPRRALGDHGEARLCLLCVQQDTVEHGVAYWHRAHQAPNVISCWKHRLILLRYCPECFRPFLRHQQLLTILWTPCECGWVCESGTAPQTADSNNNQYAILTKTVLESGAMPVDAELLALAYRQQAMKLGYQYGKNVGLKSLIESIERRFGEEFIAQIDQSYKKGKTSQWIRFSTLNRCLDMPVSRHIMLIMFLFEDFGKFQEKLLETAKYISSAKSLKNDAANFTKQKQAYREKILLIYRRWPNLRPDELWKKAFTVTTWLYDNDGQWLKSVIDPSSIQSSDLTSKDAEYARIIDTRADSLYLLNDKPLRVNKERMLKLLPKKITRGRALPIDYPLLHSQLVRHAESRWHFHVRRVLWGIAELARFNLAPNTKLLSQVTGINMSQCRLITEYYDIDLAAITSARYDPQFELSKLSINNHYDGPAEASGSYGGRMYQRKGLGP